MSVEAGPWKQSQNPRRSFEEFNGFSPLDWDGKEAPRYDWLVDGCFLRGTVAILSGDGGLGKSLLLQQLLTASATGRPWIGMATTQCRSLAIFCEDDRDELHRRQVAINQHYNCEMEHLGGLMFDSRAGRDSVMISFEKWGSVFHRLPLFEQVWQAATNHRAQIVILDTLADVFSGNEVDRNQPRAFIRELRRLALRIQGVVILTQHPSVDGLNSGTGRSGSTGWNNSVRSRLYLTTAKKDKGEDEAPVNERVLKTMKNNHAAPGGKIELVWRHGVFVRKEEPPIATPYYVKEGWRDELDR